ETVSRVGRFGRHVQQRHFGECELVVEFGRRKSPIERDEDHAEAEAGEQDDDQGRMVGAEVGDAITTTYSLRVQLCRTGQGAFVHLGVSVLDAVEADCHLVAVIGGLDFRESGQSGVGEGHRVGPSVTAGGVPFLELVGVSPGYCSDRLRDFVSPSLQMHRMLMAATTVMTIDSGTVEVESAELMIA